MGSLVDLSAGGNIGASNQNAYANLGYGADLAIDFCHGPSLKFGAEAKASAGVSAQIFEFIEGVLAVEAGIEAGLELSVQVSAEMTNNIGIYASLRAYLKAYVRARLELGLSPSAILRAAKPGMTTLQYDIFNAFLDQLEIGVGVQGNAQVALTASAEVIARGRLLPDVKTGATPGFDFRLNAEAGFLFGAGFDFFVKARFQNLKQFFGQSTTAIINEVEDVVISKNNISEENRRLVFAIWRTATTLIINGSDPDVGRFAKGVDKSLIDFIQFYLWEVVKPSLQLAIETELDKAKIWAKDSTNTDPDSDEKAMQIEALIIEMQNASTEKDFMVIYDQFILQARDFGYPGLVQVKNFGADLHMLGFLLDQNEHKYWKKLPKYAQELYENVTGIKLTALNKQHDAMLYLELNKLSQSLISPLGKAAPIVKDFMALLHNMNITFIQVMILVFSSETPQEKKNRTAILFDILEKVFTLHIAPKLDTIIKNSLPVNDRKTEFVQVLITDLSAGFSTLFIPMFKLVTGNGGTPADSERLLFMTNRFLMTLITRNITEVNKYFLNKAVGAIDTNARKLTRKLKIPELSPEFDQFGKDFFVFMEDTINSVSHYPDKIDFDDTIEKKLITATREFLGDVVGITKTAMGNQTWTPTRIKVLSESVEKLTIGPDGGAIDFTTMTLPQMENKINELMDCSFLPQGVSDEIKKLASVLQTIGLAQLKAFVFDVPIKISEFIIKVIKIIFVEIIEEILEFLYARGKAAHQAAKKALEDLKKELLELKNELIDLAAAIATEAQNLHNKAKEIVNAFFDELFNDLDLNNLDWLESVWEAIASIFGNTDKEKAEDAINKFKKKALKNLNQNLSKKQIGDLVKLNRTLPEDFKELLEATVFTDAIINDLSKINYNSSQTINDLIDTKIASVTTAAKKLDDVAWPYPLAVSNRDRKITEQADVLKQKRAYQTHFDHLKQLRKSTITINSPIAINPREGDTPMHGEYVYLSIDFDKLQIKEVLKNQSPITPDDLLFRPNRELAPQRVEQRLLNEHNPEDFGYIQTHIFVNGERINMDNVKFEGNVMNTYLKKPIIKEGRNELVCTVIAPTSLKRRTVIKPVTFFCDFKNRKIPSNGVYINLDKTVIDSMGNDHEDARRKSEIDKEKVVISNNTDSAVNLSQWTLEDAHGHVFNFPKHNGLKPGKDITVWVGEAGRNDYEWNAFYDNIKIAILNNNGEVLKLKNKEGKVISQVFTGNPRSNKDIQFVSASKPAPF